MLIQKIELWNKYNAYGLHKQKYTRDRIKLSRFMYYKIIHVFEEQRNNRLQLLFRTLRQLKSN